MEYFSWYPTNILKADNGSITYAEVSELISKRIKKSPHEISYALNGNLSIN